MAARNDDALPDLLRPGLDLVICGSAAGRRSAELGLYYAGRGNKFWRILHETGLTPRRLEPRECRTLPELGIGLTDLAKRRSGPDASLPAGAYDPARLLARIEDVRPRVLAFNGKKPAGAFLRSVFRTRLPAGPGGHGRRTEAVGGAVLHVLPSTSGAANGYWDPAPWRELARAVRAARLEDP